MTAILIGGLGLCLAALFSWSFKTLPQANWQFIGSTPLGHSDAAVNFTWYGFFSAAAYAGAVALFIFLMGSVGVPLIGAALAALPVLAICAPAAKILVRMVEGKAYGFTIGGASFVGLFAAPICLSLVAASAPWLGFTLPVEAGLAAMGICYVLGEGIGRLACISFGCCYGKPVSETSGWLRRFSNRFYFVFEGETKKIAFSSGLTGIRVVPVQAMTATLYAAVALAGIALFLEQQYGWAIAVSVGVCQIWRVYSETFRADYRGDNEFTAYQAMAVIGAGLALSVPLLLPAGSGPTPQFDAAVRALWNPPALLLIQSVWIAGFFYTGRSTQTAGSLTFSVLKDRI